MAKPSIRALGKASGDIGGDLAADIGKLSGVINERSFYASPKTQNGRGLILGATLELKGYRAARDALAGIPRAFNRVMVRALNTTTNRGYKRITKDLTGIIALPQKVIRTQLGYTKASYGNLATRTRIRGRNLSLSRFKFSQIYRTRKGKKQKAGVRVRVFRGGPALILPQAFIAKGQSRGGRDLIFQRRGAARLPLDAKKSPSVADVMQTRTVGPKQIVIDMGDDLTKEVLRGVRFELLRAQGKIAGQSVPQVP